MSEPSIGDNSQLKSIVERVNALEDRKKEAADDIKDVLEEARSNGLNPKAIRVLVRKQRQDAKKAAELEADVQAYMVAMGMI